MLVIGYPSANIVLGLVRDNVGSCSNGDCDNLLKWEDGTNFRFQDLSTLVTQVSVVSGENNFMLAADGSSINSMSGTEIVALYCACEEENEDDEYCYEAWNHIPDDTEMDGVRAKTYCSDRGLIRPLVNTPQRFFSFKKWMHQEASNHKLQQFWWKTSNNFQ